MGIIIKQISEVVIQEAPSPILSELNEVLQILQFSLSFITPSKISKISAPSSSTSLLADLIVDASPW